MLTFNERTCHGCRKTGSQTGQAIASFVCPVCKKRRYWHKRCFEAHKSRCQEQHEHSKVRW